MQTTSENPLKEKAMKHMRENIQDLKTEIETSRRNYRNRNYDKTVRNHNHKHKQKNKRDGRQNLKH